VFEAQKLAIAQIKRGLETYQVDAIARNFLKEKGIESAARPAGFAGLVLAEVDEKKVKKVEKIFEEIPEIEKAIKVHVECKAELKEIAEAVKKTQEIIT